MITKQTVNATITFDVCNKMSLTELEQKLTNDTIDMPHLFIHRSSDFVVLNVQSAEIRTFEEDDEGENVYGSIVFNCPVELDCSPDEVELTANYLLNEFNIKHDWLFVGLKNGECIDFEVNAIWIEWKF